MSNRNYSFKDDWPVPPRMWVKITGTKIGIPIDTDPMKSYRENVRMCLLAAEREYHAKGDWKAGAKLSGNERLIGEVTGSEGAWPFPKEDLMTSCTPSAAALALMKEHKHSYVWLEGKPEHVWELAQELVDCGYAQWGGEDWTRKTSRGVSLTNRALHYLK